MDHPHLSRSCQVELPSILNCLTDPAIVIDTNLRIIAANNAYRERFFGGERVCGRHCYEVSHRYQLPCDEVGETCPIRSCRESGTASRVLHIHHSPRGQEHEEVVAYPIPDETGAVTSFLETIRPQEVASIRPSTDRMVGSSPAFNRMLSLASRVAPSEVAVLLQGESGTGKELVANAVHRMSQRAERSFVPIECSGLTESLFESELFGYEKGAFTGAANRRRGLVELSDGGTLFLDEVGDTPLNLQVKLLRLLETGLFRRVGGTDQHKVDFRLICATNQDLSTMTRSGAFRKDLYYRISAFPIELPPLRERPEDLGPLIETFRERLGCTKEIHPEAMAVLERYSFPGNIRELLNIVTRACLLADGDVIEVEHLSRECREPGTEELLGENVVDEPLPLAEFEARYLLHTAAQFPGNKRELATKLGLSERSLYRRLRAARRHAAKASATASSRP